MRIIGGKFKGKKLFLPQDKKTRPLKDMVKESIFNLLQHSNKFKVQLENTIHKKMIQTRDKLSTDTLISETS